MQKLTYILTATHNNCSISDTVVISVLPKIQAQIIGSTTVCPFAKNITYTSPITPESGVKVLKWEVFGGSPPPPAGGAIPPPAGGGGLPLDSLTVNWGQENDKAFVKLLLQNQLGCKDSVILPVKISPMALPISLTPPSGVGGLILCYGEKINIGRPALANYQYFWFQSQNLDSLVQLSSTNIANPELKNLTRSTQIRTFTYYVRGLNTQTGCQYLDSIKVQISPQIFVDAGKDSLICSNTSLLLASQISTPPVGLIL